MARDRLSQERCRGIAGDYVTFLNAVGLLVPAGPPREPEKFHYSYRLDDGVLPLRLEDGWAFHVHGNLTGCVMESSVVVCDAPHFDAAIHTFLCDLSPHHPTAWSGGHSFFGLLENRRG